MEKKAEQEAEEPPPFLKDPVEPPPHIKTNKVYSSAYKVSLNAVGDTELAQAKGREAAAQLRAWGVVSKSLVGVFRKPRSRRRPQIKCPGYVRFCSRVSSASFQNFRIR